MSGSNSNKRAQSLAIRCYNLRQEGCTLSEIAELVGIEKDKVNTRIKLGERLLQKYPSESHEYSRYHGKIWYD